MRSFPLRIGRRAYSGRDARRRAAAQEFNRIAGRVEAHLNADLAAQPENSVSSYSNDEIARALGEDADLVRDVVFAADCGANGITILKGDLDLALAPVEADRQVEVGR